MLPRGGLRRPAAFRDRHHHPRDVATLLQARFDPAAPVGQCVDTAARGGQADRVPGGGRGGIGVFLTPSAGYLLGYALAACIVGAIMAALPQSTPKRAAFSALLASVLGGLICLHAVGVLGLMGIAQLSLAQAFKVTLAFVPGDLIKCILCAVIVHTVARGMPDWRFGGRHD